MHSGEPDTIRLATRFLQQLAPRCQRLFILGDLVEYWVGDDADDGTLDDVFDSMAALHEFGTECWVLHGNRDFLLGHAFAARTRTHLVTDDQIVIDSETSDPLLLLHGDSLCTRDTDYQRLRQQLRDPLWRKKFLAQSTAERCAYAQSLRQRSRNDSAGKTAHEMAVVDEAVLSLASEFGVARMLHGHTHRPCCHTLDSGTQHVTRWVVGDWHSDHAVIGVLENGQLRLETFR